MSIFFVILKAIVVIVFLVMFLRSSKLVWGIGLITVTSAILLDTFLGTFSRDEMMEEMGFFFYIISGILAGGGAIWLWGIISPIIKQVDALDSDFQPVRLIKLAAGKTTTNPTIQATHPETTSGYAVDRKMLHDQIRQRLGPDDLLDLIFDLGWAENDIVSIDEDTPQLINNIINKAEQHGQTGDLALAVERVLTPIPPENLPRVEKLSPSSPRAVLRHYLIAHYSIGDLQDCCQRLQIDWESLPGNNKNSKIRNLLLYLDRRNRLFELVEIMQAVDSPAPEDDTTA